MNPLTGPQTPRGPEAAGAALSFFPLRGEELARAPTRYARRLEDLRTALSNIVAAEAGLAGAQAHRTSALEAAATVTDPMAT